MLLLLSILLCLQVGSLFPGLARLSLVSWLELVLLLRGLPRMTSVVGVLAQKVSCNSQELPSQQARARVASYSAAFDTHIRG